MSNICAESGEHRVYSEHKSDSLLRGPHRDSQQAPHQSVRRVGGSAWEKIGSLSGRRDGASTVCWNVLGGAGKGALVSFERPRKIGAEDGAAPNQVPANEAARDQVLANEMEAARRAIITNPPIADDVIDRVVDQVIADLKSESAAPQQNAAPHESAAPERKAGGLPDVRDGATGQATEASSIPVRPAPVKPPPVMMERTLLDPGRGSEGSRQSA